MRQYTRALAVAGFAILPLAATAQTDEEQDRDRGFLAGLIEDNLSGAGREVIITGFEGALSSTASIEVMTIADDEGVWLRAEDLVLDWNRSALLRGRLEVEELSAGLISLVRPPMADPQAPAAEATPFSLPDLPVSVQLDNLSAARIELGEAFLGEAVALQLNGTMQLADGEGSASIVAERLGDRRGRFEISGSYANESRILDLTLDLDEAESGIVARVLDLPGRPAVALTLDGSGPIDDFDAQLALATDGTQRITGGFSLDRGDASDTGSTPLAFALDVDGDVTPLLAPAYQDFFGPEVALAVAGSREADGSLALSQLSVAARAISLEGEAMIGADGWPERFDLSGNVGAADGGPVQLPIPGAPTMLDQATLSLQFDKATGDRWVLDLEARDFTRPGLTIPRLTMSGGGVIVEATASADSLFTADIDYAAEGLQFDDAGLADALGDRISGEIVLERDGDNPVIVDRITLDGPGIALNGNGTVDGADNGFETVSELSLSADRLDRFAGLTGLGLGGAAALDIASTIRPLDGAFDVTLSGSTTDLALGNAQLDPYLDGAGTVALRAIRDETGTRVEQLEIATPEMQASAEAEITSGVSSAVFDVTVTDAGQALPGASGPATLVGTAERDAAGATTANVTATLPNGRAVIDASQATEEDGGLVTLDMTADFSDLAPFAALADRPLSGAAKFAATGTLAADGSTFDLVIDADTADLTTGVAQADPLLRGDVALSGNVVRSGAMSFRVEDLALTSPSLSATGRAELNDTTAVFDLVADSTDLAPIGEAIDRPLTGAVEITAAGSLETDLSALDLRLDAVATDVTTGIAQADPLLRGRVALSGHATRTGPDSFAVDELTLASPALRASGTADVVDGLASFDLDADITDLGPVGDAVDRPLSGAVDLTASGTSALDLSRFDLTLDATASDLGTGLSQADTLFGGSLSVSGHAVRTGPDDLLVEGLKITSDTLNASGQARIVAGAGDFDIALDVADLAPVGTLAGRPLSGAVALTAKGSITDDLSLFDVTLDGTARDLETGIAQLDPLFAGATTLQAQAIRSGADDFALPKLMLQSPQIQVTGNGAVVDGVASGDFDIDLPEVSVLAPGLTGPASVTATASGTADGAIDFTLDGTAQGTEIAATGQVAPAAQGREITTRLSADIASLAPFSRLAGRELGGSLGIDASGSVMPDLSRFDLSIDARAGNLDVGIPAVETLLAGSGTATARLRRDAPGALAIDALEVRFPNFSIDADGTAGGDGQNVTFDARLADVGLFTPDFSGPVTARGSASRDASGTLQIDASATGPGGTTAEVSGAYLADGTLDLDVSGAAQLGLVNDLIEPRRLSGTANFDLSVNGPPALSSVSGTISTAGAQLAAPTLGVALNDIDTTIRLDGASAQVDLTGTLDDGGRITITGPVALSGGYDAGLVIRLDELQLSDPELYRTTASGQLSVTGPLAGGASIAGRIDLGATEIQVPSSGIGALGELPEVRHVGAPQAVQRTLNRAGLTIAGVEIGKAGGADAGGPGAVYALDVTISAPARVFIRGRGLDAELGGELVIGGSTAQVIPVGQFELVRGRLDILQQRFELDEGGAYLQGDFTPFIRLVATTETATGTTVSIIVEGPATEPEVRFESSPQLPQDEVLAQLIFGRDLSSISPLQAVQLAAAVGTLAGTGGGGLIDDFRQGTGLDDLDITTDDSGNAAVRAGKYLSENIYTDVTVGSEQSSVNLNLDVTSDITATGSVTSDGESSLGVFFERDY